MRYEVTVKFEVEAETLLFAQNKVESSIGASDSGYTGPSYRMISVVEKLIDPSDARDSPHSP